MERLCLAAAGGIATGTIVGLFLYLLRWKENLESYTAKAKQSLQPGNQPSFKTREELKDFWTVHNKRYSLNSFVDAHPGGSLAILLGKGQNCTELFEAYHSLAAKSKVSQMLSKYLTDLPDAVKGDYDFDDTFEWKNTPFTDTLNRRVKQYFIDNNISHKATTSKGIYLFFFTLLSLVCLFGFFEGNWIAMVVLPFAYWLGPSTMMHDGSHFTLSFKPWINMCCAYLGSAHMSLSTWNQQHVIGHHVHTNMDGRDPDLYHFTFLTRYHLHGFRVSDLQRSESMHKFWLKGVIIRSMLTTFGPALLWDPLSFVVNGGKFLGIVRGPPASWKMLRILIHFLGRLIIVSACFLQPVLRLAVRLKMGRDISFFDWLQGSSHMTVLPDVLSGLDIVYEVFQTICFISIPYAIHGIIFYAFSQVSHVQPSCAHTPKHLDGTKESKTTNNEWAVHQVKSTVDWGVTSVIWLHLSNGLSHQTAHHLFPQVDWCHYIAIGPIIERTCAEFGVPYVKLPSFWSALNSHLSHIGDLNIRPKRKVRSEKRLPFPPVVDTDDGKHLEVTLENVEGLAFLGQLHSFR